MINLLNAAVGQCMIMINEFIDTGDYVYTSQIMLYTLG